MYSQTSLFQYPFKGILLTVTIIYELYEAYMSENQELLKAMGVKMGM